MVGKQQQASSDSMNASQDFFISQAKKYRAKCIQLFLEHNEKVSLLKASINDHAESHLRMSDPESTISAVLDASIKQVCNAHLELIQKLQMDAEELSRKIRSEIEDLRLDGEKNETVVSLLIDTMEKVMDRMIANAKTKMYTFNAAVQEVSVTKKKKFTTMDLKKKFGDILLIEETGIEPIPSVSVAVSPKRVSRLRGRNCTVIRTPSLDSTLVRPSRVAATLGRSASVAKMGTLRPIIPKVDPTTGPFVRRMHRKGEITWSSNGSPMMYVEEVIGATIKGNKGKRVRDQIQQEEEYKKAMEQLLRATTVDGKKMKGGNPGRGTKRK